MGTGGWGFSRGRDSRQDVRGFGARGERERKRWIGKGMRKDVGRRGA